MAKKYNVVTGRWTTVKNNAVSSAPVNKSSTTTSKKGTASKPPTTSNSSKPQKDTEKKYRTLERNVLKGDADVVSNPRLKAKQTIYLHGLGKFVSGLYFVDKVTHTWSKDGYEQSLELSRNAVGDTTRTINSKTPSTKVGGRATKKPVTKKAKGK
jgi:hypothetical protein